MSGAIPLLSPCTRRECSWKTFTVQCVNLMCVCPCIVAIRGEENQLDATQWFIELVICSTCFGHLYAHHQELETIHLVTTCGV
jgi:hypothetical protein